jgi:DNA-binding protein H-NS
MNKSEQERFLKAAKGADLPALENLITQLTGMAEEIKVEKRAGLKERIEEMLAGAGTNIAEVYGKIKQPSTRAAKYRDPNNPTNTWTGQGRMPGWMTEKKKAGVNPEDFRIKEEEPAKT